jgi:hypothetical protein
MDRRITRIFVLGFACLWFGMLVPIHQRGQIQLPGPGFARADGATDTKAHCPGGPNAPCHAKQKARPGSAPGDGPAEDAAGGGCAVCHFIAGLDLPAPIDLGIAPLGFLHALPSEVAPAAPARHGALPFHGLDPPLA